MEICLRENGETNIKIPEKENIFGYQERNPDVYMTYVAIFNTKIIIYKRRPDRGDLRLKEVLQLIYTEMLNDEYDCEVKLKPELFERRWRKYSVSLRTKFP